MLRPILWWFSMMTLAVMILAKVWEKRGWRRFWCTYFVLLGLWWLNLYCLLDSNIAKPWAGPWRTQVVDAETQQPLEGVATQHQDWCL